jgi:hypothetical protein
MKRNVPLSDFLGIMSATAQAFADISIEPHELNAMYDAAKNGRKIDKFFSTGLYTYAEGGELKTVSALPSPVAANPKSALDEAGETFIKISLFFDKPNQSWRARCFLEGDHNIGAVNHASRDQALCRAIMQAVCLNRIMTEGHHAKA